MGSTRIFSDFLSALGVPHTAWYSDRRFDTMTFHSLFGLSKLLQSYGVENEALEVADKPAALAKLTPPFLARMNDSFVIVTGIGPECVTFRDGISEDMRTQSRGYFASRWSGIVLLAYPDDGSSEPDYAAHRFTQFGNKAKKWVLLAAILFIFTYLFISNGIWSHVSTVLLTLIDLAGLFVTYELLLKSLNIQSDTGDSICGIIDRTGCHTVLGTSASKFFGLFGWSEVGFAYFGVSLLALLIFPQYIGYLALINACCCPFSFWSVWYQKYRAKAWCTLCLIVQGCLWLSLACYIFGGWFRYSFPIGWQLFVLGASYVTALLTINALMPAFDKNEDNQQ